MPASIVASPGAVVVPVNQPLIFTFASSVSPLPADFRFIVQILEQGTTLIGTYYLAPNGAERAHFDLSPVIFSRVEHDVEDNSGAPLFSDSNIPILAKGVKNSKGYTIRVGSYTGGTGTLNEANTSMVVIDGMVEPRLGLNPSFSAYYPLNSSRKVWLTEYPLIGTTISIPCMETDDGAVAFLYNDYIGTGVANVRSRVFNGASIVDTTFTAISTNGLSATTSNELLAGNALGYLKGYPKNWLAYIGYTGAWTKIQHVLTDSSSNQISAFLEFTNYCEVAKNEITRLAFANTLGGWDYITFTGLRRKSYQRNSREYKSIPGSWNASTFALKANATNTKTYHLDTAERYALTKLVPLAEQPLLESLAKSKQMYLTISGQYLPVKLNTNTFNVRTSANAKMSVVEMEFELTQ